MRRKINKGSKGSKGSKSKGNKGNEGNAAADMNELWNAIYKAQR